MTLSEHKRHRTGESFFAVSRRYIELCESYQGSPEAPAAVLRVYVFAARDKEEVLTLTEREIKARMQGLWSERTIASARAFLLQAGLLISDGHRRGSRLRVSINFARLEDHSDQDEQVVQSAAAPDEEVVQNCTGFGEVVQNCTALPLYKELESKELASVAQAFAGVTIRGEWASEATLRNLAQALATVPMELREAVLREGVRTARHARSWGLPVEVLREYRPPAPQAAPAPPEPQEQAAQEPVDTEALRARVLQQLREILPERKPMAFALPAHERMREVR